MEPAEQTAEHEIPGRNRRRLPATAAVVAFVLAAVAVGLAVRNDDDPTRQTTAATVVAQPTTAAPASPAMPEATRATTTPASPTTVPEPAPRTTTPATVSSTVAKPATTVAPESLDSASRLRVDGIGPIRIGMTLEQVRAASGVKMSRSEGGVCVGYRTDGAPAGLAFTAVEGSNRLDFVSVSEPSIATVSGIRVGSTVADVRRTYGDSLKGSVQGGWGRLVFRATDPSLDRFAMVFLFSDGKVAGIWSGLRTIVEGDEICA